MPLRLLGLYDAMQTQVNKLFFEIFSMASLFLRLGLDGILYNTRLLYDWEVRPIIKS